MVRQIVRNYSSIAIAVFLGGWPLVSATGAETGDGPFAAVEFDGSRARIRVPHHDDINPGKENWTCAFWVKMQSGFSIRHSKFIAKRDGTGASGGFYIGSQLAPACSDGKRQNLDYQSHIAIGEWTHVAVQIDRDNGKLRAFINGEQVAASDSQLTGAVESQSDLVIGGDSTGDLQGNHCLLRDVRIWRGPLLTATDLRAVLAGKTDMAADGLVSHWPLGEGSGEIAQDLISGHHGEFSGNPEWVLSRLLTADLPENKDIQPDADVTFGPIRLVSPQGEVRYQWYRNDKPIENATQAQLDIADFSADHTGVYHVEIRDDSEHTPIESTRLTIEWPTWRTDLEAVSAAQGASATLGPVELYAPPRGEVRYQWYRDGAPIEGATESTLNIESVTQKDLGTYHVVVDDAHDYTPVTSRSARLVEPDWPMWQFDAARSADTAHKLADELHLQWVRHLPEPERAWRFQWDDRGKLDFDLSYSPVVMGERIFVPSNVSDSLTVYHIEDGRELWRFHADGPVRLAPVAWRDSVYFGSDDGYVYCLNAEDGALKWKFRGGPSDHRLLGNERIINFWSVRGGPVIQEQTLYFTAGIWPLHGVFVYALDAETGEVEWVNDVISSDYVQLPHGRARGYGGLAPQGYIAAAADQLVIAAGRGPNPVHLNRHTGDVIAANYRGSKGHGSYAVHAVEGGGMGRRRNAEIERAVNALSDQIDGKAFESLVAHDRLFISTEDGTLYCFGPEEVDVTTYAHRPTAIKPRSTRWAETARHLLDALGETKGYALMLGSGSGDLMREILNRSDLHLVVVESDPERVRTLRDELAAAGAYGRSGAAVIEADPATFTVQPYLFSLVLSESAAEAGIDDASTVAYLLDRLRPYGGIAWLGDCDVTEKRLQTELDAKGPDATGLQDLGQFRFASLRRPTSARTWLARFFTAPNNLLVWREGALPRAGQWTHQLHDAANSMLSRDERVRLPLGILWYGGPSNHNILPRHAGGPRPQVAGGRQVFLGVENIAARCVYTGRELWEREFPGIGHPFTNLGLERRWQNGNQVYMSNIPGATYIGSPFVTLPGAVYLRYKGSIYTLDPVTGETVGRVTPPGRSVAEIYDDEDTPDWGHVSVRGDHLITTSEPHMFGAQKLDDLGLENHRGTSSRRLAVLDRHSGTLLWEREARIGFRHNAIVSSEDTVFVIDGLSEEAVKTLARRGETPDENSVVLALDLATGVERWRADSGVFGTFLLYSEAHDILIEGGSQDLRRRLGDEPRNIAARRGANGEALWEAGRFMLPAAIHGDMLIPGRPGKARSILTGEVWQRTQPHTGVASDWEYRRAYGCNTLSASINLLLFRSGYAAYYDLERHSGTGNFSGFRSGCTANMVAADGLLNALDYTRSCTCSYAHQTSLALVHMPDDPNIEFWSRYDGDLPDPAGHGVNFGAPGRRVDTASGRIWHDRAGTRHRHPSAIQENGGGHNWVASSVREGEGEISVDDLLNATCTVRLHFADLDEAVKAGDRVFDVYLDGEKVLEGFDIVGRTGAPLRGTVETFTVDVSGGQLTINLRGVDGSKHEPVISGIELIADDLD